MSAPVEISWFGALCDDDYEFLGVPNPELQSSWNHCRDIVQTADRNGFDNILLPSGYQLGIDSTGFASAIATHTEQINLLLAVRIGEMWLPQLARQLATIDQMAEGRLTINIISSDMPGQSLDSSLATAEPSSSCTACEHCSTVSVSRSMVSSPSSTSTRLASPPSTRVARQCISVASPRLPSSVLPKPPTCSSPGPTRSPRWVKPSPTCAAVPMRSGAN